MDMSHKFKQVAEWLEDDRVRVLVENDDLDGVFKLLHNETPFEYHYLTRYLLSLGIQPLDYMSNVLDEMFMRVYRDGEIGTRLTIPNKIHQLGDYAFYKCSGLVEVTLPASVNKIGWGAFSGCTNLRRVTVECSWASFDDQVFEYCPEDLIVTVPKNATFIPYLQKNNIKYREA